MTSERLGTATTAEVSAWCRRALLLVPIGSTEQHGPHLPLDTDTRIAVALCERAAALSRQLVPDSSGVPRRRRVVAPAVPYGASGEHAHFAGTLSIGTEALCSMLVELVRSADRFAGAVLASAHGGNHDAVMAAVSLLSSEGRRVAAWWPRVAGGDAHAGETETSLLLAIAPELVRLGRLRRGQTAPLSELMAALRAGGISSVSANGVLGDPLAASRGRGEELLEELVSDLDRAVISLEEPGGAPS